MNERTNQEWRATLTGAQPDAAITDLRALLIRSLRYALAAHRVTEMDLEDFAQDALLMVLQKLDSFRGEACFTTWARKVAVRVALTELRRRRWCDVSLESLLAEHEGADFTPHFLVDPAPGPGQVTFKKMMIEWLQQIIAQELTDRQRCTMFMALSDEMGPQDAALLLDTNRNAIYKLLHDARHEILKQVEDAGLPVDQVRLVFLPYAT